MKDIQLYFVVIFLSHFFLIFPWFLRMVMYANEFETKERRKLTKLKINCRNFIIYCTFQKHANSEVQKPTDSYVFRCCQSSKRIS